MPADLKWDRVKVARLFVGESSPDYQAALARFLATEKKARAVKRSEWHRLNAWHPHQARHRAATDFRKHGGMDVAQVQLGHAHQTTTEIYAEADVESRAACVERMG
jgi:integrase